jgi:exonuclease III
MASLLQWNVRGFNTNYSDVDLLIKDHDPSVICLQETQIKTNIKMKYYQSYNVMSTAADGRACGVVSLLIKNKTPQSQVVLNTTLQTVAVRMTLHKTITICCIYCPPSKPLPFRVYGPSLSCPPTISPHHGPSRLAAILSYKSPLLLAWVY